MQRASQPELPPPDLVYFPDDSESVEFGFSDAVANNNNTVSAACHANTATRPPRIPPQRASLERSTGDEPTAAASPVGLRDKVGLREMAGVVAASHLRRPPAPRVSSGVEQVDYLTGGLPRGGVTEICGGPSSGRTSFMLSAIARATGRGEMCALVDASDCFSPHSAAAAGVDLERLLWVRCAANVGTLATATSELPAPDVAAVCSSLQQKQAAGSVMPHAKVWYGRSPARSERGSTGRDDAGGSESLTRDTHGNALTAKNTAVRLRHGVTESRVRASDRRHWARCVDQALRATDLLLQGGGFGMVVIDLGDVPQEIARRIPLTSWFRFRRVVESTPAVLLSIVRQSCAKTCASLVLEMQGYRRAAATTPEAAPAHARIFTGLSVRVEVARTAEQQGHEKKSPSPASAAFHSQTEWTRSASFGDRAIG